MYIKACYISNLNKSPNYGNKENKTERERERERDRQTDRQREEMPYREKDCEQSSSVVPGNGQPHRTHVTSGTVLTIASEFYVL